jgi:hypothetical protein
MDFDRPAVSVMTIVALDSGFPVATVPLSVVGTTAATGTLLVDPPPPPPQPSKTIDVRAAGSHRKDLTEHCFMMTPRL